MDATESAGEPRAFLCALPVVASATGHRLIEAMAGPMLESEMAPDRTSVIGRRGARIVIDDRSRLPGRFFGRFMTSATSGLLGAL
jgi:hypothetical protein